MVRSPSAANKTTFGSHPIDPELVGTYLRPWVEAGSKTGVFIHEANVYAVDPAELTRDPKYPPVIAADGKCAWYFYVVLQPRHKSGRRKARTVAGGGCWHHESTKPVCPDGNGKRQIGARKNFSFVIKERGVTIRTGWLMSEFVLLADGNHGEAQDAASRNPVICKVYPSPRNPEPRGSEATEAEPDEASNAIGAAAAPTFGMGDEFPNFNRLGASLENQASNAKWAAEPVTTLISVDEYLNLERFEEAQQEYRDLESQPNCRDFLSRDAPHADEERQGVTPRSAMAADPGPGPRLELGCPSSTSSQSQHVEEERQGVTPRSTMAADPGPGPRLELGCPSSTSSQLISKVMETPSPRQALPEQPQQEIRRAKKRRRFPTKIKISSARDGSRPVMESTAGVAQSSIAVVRAGMQTDFANESRASEPTTQAQNTPVASAINPPQLQQPLPDYDDWAFWFDAATTIDFMSKNMFNKINELLNDRTRLREENTKLAADRDHQVEELRKETEARRKEHERHKEALAREKAKYELSLNIAKEEAKHTAVEAGAHVLGLLQSHYRNIKPQILKEGFDCDRDEADRLISEGEQYVESLFEQLTSSDNKQT